MRRGTLRWGLIVAAVAVVLLALWLLLPGETPAPPAAEPELPVLPFRLHPIPQKSAVRMPSISTSWSGPECGDPPASSPPLEPNPAPRRVVVEGKVLGLGGEPVPGASVNLLLPPGHGEGPVVAQDVFIPDPGWPDSGVDDVFALMRESASAGEDGSFRIEAEARPSAGLIAWGGAYANTIVEPFSMEEDVRGLVLRMEPAVALAGVVMEAAGPYLDGREPAPIAGAEVALMKPALEGRWIHLRTERTDVDGRFRTWGWTPGIYGLRCRQEGLRTKFIPNVGVPHDGLDVRMMPADVAVVAGRVTLPDGSTPAPGVIVLATTRQASGGVLGDYGRGETDGEGRFRIEGLEVGPGGSGCWLLLDVDGGERGMASLSDRAWRPGTEVDLALLPRPARTLRVRAVDGGRGEGGPVGGVRLVARATLAAPAGRGTGMEIERPFTTGRDGSFEVEGLPGEYVRLGAAGDEWDWELADRHRPALQVPEAPSEGPWETEVEVVRRGRIRGIVTAPDGAPAPCVHVEVVGNAGDRSAASAAITGADGRFALHGVTSRRPVTVRARPSPGSWTDAPAVSLEPGSTLEGLVIRLPVSVDFLAGRIVDEQGQPRPEVRVAARRQPEGPWSDSSHPSAWTGTGGRYRIDVPPGSEWRLRVESPGLTSDLVGPVRPGDPVPDLVLRPLPDAK